MPYKDSVVQKKKLREYQRTLRESKVFVDHIQNHLGSGLDVVCKICNKTMGQIVEESYKKKEEKVKEKVVSKSKTG